MFVLVSPTQKANVYTNRRPTPKRPQLLKRNIEGFTGIKGTNKVQLTSMISFE